MPPRAGIHAGAHPHYETKIHEIMRPRTKRIVSENAEFIEIRKAAEWLGVPFSSLRQYVSRGLLPSYKLGRHRLFRKSEILAALRQTTKATLDEILR